MQVKVKTIPVEGLEIDEDKEDSFVNSDNDDVKFLGTIKLSAHIEKTEGAIIAQINAKGVLSTPCYRCLEDVKEDYSEDFAIDFPVNKNTEIVEMDEDLRQEIILGLPERLLCKESCKGLCLGCGVNLNIEKCKCK